MSLLKAHEWVKANYADRADKSAIFRQAAHLWKAVGPEEAQRLIIEGYGLPSPKLRPLDKPRRFAVFGDGFESGVYDQMKAAMSLPHTVAGALMPDGHPGYALPIGGVVMTEGVIHPYFVGVDIGCRVTVSLYNLPLDVDLNRVNNIITRVSHFGPGAAVFTDGRKREHPVMEDPLWREIRILRELKDLAASQLGSSGGGNHFVDFLRVDGLPGVTHALMTHSGSRGVGAKLAKHYHDKAIKYTQAVARGVQKDYSWLPLSGEGAEYLAVMRLMGRYAQANHHLIHVNFAREFGCIPASPMIAETWVRGLGLDMLVVENHHNFAWTVVDEEDGLIIHRKGATPAHLDQPGIIPGTSGTPSYLVRGLGNADSLFSSSHGAGRPFSRSEAKRRHTPAVDNHYTQAGIITQGVAPDETLAAYKDIRQVIGAQKGVLLDVVAEMHPLVVHMGGHAWTDDGD